MKATVRELWGLGLGLRQVCENLQQRTPALSLEECIQIGQLLWDIAKLTKSTLEPIKKCLRTEVLGRAPGPGAVRLNAPDGARCTVTVPAPQVRVEPTTNFLALREMLGDELFGDLFEEVPATFRPRRNFRLLVSQLKDPKQIKATLESVHVTEDVPRVSFKN